LKREKQFGRSETAFSTLAYLVADPLPHPEIAVGRRLLQVEKKQRGVITPPGKSGG
jgi:hypothetical protein